MGFVTEIWSLRILYLKIMKLERSLNWLILGFQQNIWTILIRPEDYAQWLEHHTT